MSIKHTIGKQRQALKTILEPAMLNLSKLCVVCWLNSKNLDNVLNKHFSTIPYSHLIYAINKYGKQISSNISSNGIDPRYCEQDLSERPYFVTLYLKKRVFILSSVYISQNTGHPCITAFHPVIDESLLFLGFLVADLDIRNLPLFVNSEKTSQFKNLGNHNIPFIVPLQYRAPFDKFRRDI